MPGTGNDRRRSDDYHQARIGASAALTGVLAVILILDALIPGYDVSPITVAAILGTVAALMGVELRNRP
jgi:hypothetical protein